MSETTETSNVEDPPHVSGNRRALLGKGAMAAAVAAAASLAVNRNASAADGQFMVVGQPNTASSTTAISGGSTLAVTGGGTAGSANAIPAVNASIVGRQTAVGAAGVVGSNSGDGGWGLWGEHTSTADTGVGVIGASSNGAGVVGAGTAGDLVAGGSGTIVFIQGAFPATPPAGTTVGGTLAKADDGSLWYSPTSGEWVKLAGDGQFMVVGTPNTATSTTAISGGSTLVVTDGSTAGATSGTPAVEASIVGRQTAVGAAGVVGSNSGDGGWGLWGEHTSTTDTGVGVIGASSNGAGVVGAGTDGDLVAAGSGAIVFAAGLFAATPPAGASTPGTLAKADDGSLWYSPASGQWSKLAGPSTVAAGAGTFHVIAPVRVYDSRLPSPSQGKLATGQNRVVSVADARNEVSGLVTTADVVPVGATAVVANLTVTETEGELGGFLAVLPGDATALSGSSINWSGANQNIANGLTAKIAADRTVKVFCGGVPTPRTHFVMDVTGYWI